MHKRLLPVAFVLSFCLSSSARSSASELGGSQQIQWPWLFDQGVNYLARVRANMARPPHSILFEVPTGAPWFGDKFRLTLLARNRGSTSSLLGDDVRSAVDFATPRRTTRMLVDRFVLYGGRWQPFVQVGVGQWRRDVDRRFFGDTWTGFQYGLGMQFVLTKDIALDLEADHAFWRNSAAAPRTFENPSAFLGIQIRLP